MAKSSSGEKWLEQLDQLLEEQGMSEGLKYEIVSVSDGLTPKTYVSAPVPVGEDRRAAAALEHFFVVDQIEHLRAEQERIRKLALAQCAGIEQQIENLLAKKDKLWQILKFSATEANGEERAAAPTATMTPSEALRREKALG